MRLVLGATRVMRAVCGHTSTTSGSLSSWWLRSAWRQHWLQPRPHRTSSLPCRKCWNIHTAGDLLLPPRLAVEPLREGSGGGYCRGKRKKENRWYSHWGRGEFRLLFSCAATLYTDQFVSFFLLCPVHVQTHKLQINIQFVCMTLSWKWCLSKFSETNCST